MMTAVCMCTLQCCSSLACTRCLQVWTCEKADFEELTETEVHKSKRYMTLNAFANYWPRLVATCMAWVANVSLASCKAWLLQRLVLLLRARHSPPDKPALCCMCVLRFCRILPFTVRAGMM